MNTITHFVKTPVLLTAHYENGATTTVCTSDFKAWVDKYDHRLVTWPNADCESDQEDAKLLSWEEYWNEPWVLGDVQTYLETRQRVDKIMQPLVEILREYSPIEKQMLVSSEGKIVNELY